MLFDNIHLKRYIIKYHICIKFVYKCGYLLKINGPTADGYLIAMVTWLL